MRLALAALALAGCATAPHWPTIAANTSTNRLCAGLVNPTAPQPAKDAARVELVRRSATCTPEMAEAGRIEAAQLRAAAAARNAETDRLLIETGAALMQQGQQQNRQPVICDTQVIGNRATTVCR